LFIWAFGGVHEKKKWGSKNWRKRKIGEHKIAVFTVNRTTATALGMTRKYEYKAKSKREK